MMRSYCTLTDKNYLYQALALYNSLVSHAGDFTLYILCMDDAAHELMVKMALPRLVPVPVGDLLTDDVRAVRARTTHGQFCWVCQPLLCEFILDRHRPDMVTYLEADSLFFSSPEPLFAEIGARSVSLVPHNYAPGLDATANSGMFCVQFNAFRNDSSGREVLAYWRSCCFKYDKSRPTVFPGQTTLDEWPTRFPAVAVIRHIGAGVAPWNVLRYRLTTVDGTPCVDGVPVVFYHYHEYGRFANGDHELGRYPITPVVIDTMYPLYIRALDRAKAMVVAVDPTFTHRRTYRVHPTLLDVLRSRSMAVLRDYLEVIKRKVRGRYNVHPNEYFQSPSNGGGGAWP